MVNKREENYKKLEKIYSNSDFVKIKTHDLSKISNFAFPIICKAEGLVDKYIRLAERAEIEVRPIVGGDMTTQPFFKKHVEFEEGDFAVFTGEIPPAKRMELWKKSKVIFSTPQGLENDIKAVRNVYLYLYLCL